MVNNLLSNAARYTPPHGRIEVRAAREGDDVVLRVRDNGIGIDPALLPNVFEMFVQGARGSDRSQGGLGLGLSLVQQRSPRCTGARSAPTATELGRGSEFTVRLPLVDDRPFTRPTRWRPAPSGVASSQRKRVLVVDDNRDGAQMISMILARAGHEVQVANHPSQALSLADSFRPQIAILDIGLPVMDGYSLGRELRARLTAAPILVALTGYGQNQDRRRSEQAGFKLHLVKPVSAEMLVNLMDALVEPSA